MRQNGQGWTTLVAVALTAAGVYFSARTTFRQETQRAEVFTTPPLTELSPNVIPIVTLNQQAIFDDVIHLWLMQVLLHPEAPRQPEKLESVIRATLKHRPKIESLYMLTCFVAMRDLGRPQLCQEITLAGLEVFPQSWRLPMTQGFVHAFVLNEPLQAANFYLLASTRPKSPPYVANVARKLAQREDISEQDYRKSLELMLGGDQPERFRSFLERYGSARPQGASRHDSP